jgi:hypothetical protein
VACPNPIVNNWASIAARRNVVTEPAIGFKLLRLLQYCLILMIRRAERVEVRQCSRIHVERAATVAHFNLSLASILGIGSTHSSWPKPVSFIPRK